MEEFYYNLELFIETGNVYELTFISFIVLYPFFYLWIILKLSQFHIIFSE